MVAYAVFVLVVIASGGCERRMDAADREALRLLEERFGGRYRFRLEGDLYLLARLRAGTIAPPDELDAVYRVFFFNREGGRCETTFVYLNVYDARGRFLRQIAYDPVTGGMIEGRTEYYR